ncbi:MAG: SH3 domain-containing protein [Firmicutes bacterium]|nr:SH3 domain-containing protein [Bacillota bacterium]
MRNMLKKILCMTLVFMLTLGITTPLTLSTAYAEENEGGAILWIRVYDWSGNPIEVDHSTIRIYDGDVFLGYADDDGAKGVFFEDFAVIRVVAPEWRVELTELPEGWKTCEDRMDTSSEFLFQTVGQFWLGHVIIYLRPDSDDPNLAPDPWPGYGTERGLNISIRFRTEDDRPIINLERYDVRVNVYEGDELIATVSADSFGFFMRNIRDITWIGKPKFRIVIDPDSTLPDGLVVCPTSDFSPEVSPGTGFWSIRPTIILIPADQLVQPESEATIPTQDPDPTPQPDPQPTSPIPTGELTLPIPPQPAAPAVVTPEEPTPQQEVAPPVQQAVNTATVTAHSLTLRSGSGVNHRAIGWLHNGDIVTILSRQGNWVQVETARGIGWVFGRYIQ